MLILDLISENNSINVVGHKIILDLEVPNHLAKLNLQNSNALWMEYKLDDTIESLRTNIVKEDLGSEPRAEEIFRNFIFFVINGV